LNALACSLDALSPLRVLERGYSITEHAESGEVIRTAEELSPGDEIRTRLASGSVLSRVHAVDPR
jgi:exodeoxyribonuclease VII large subunit